MNKTNSINSSSLFLVSGGAKGIESEPSFAQECFDESVLKKRIM